MKKLVTYSRYFFEYLKYGDFQSIYYSVKYILFKTSHKSDRIIKTSVGTFFCRKNTNDFQFANYAYEWGVKKYLLDHCREYTVFIDGGACVGDYSILLSRYGLKCFAFEPIEQNFNVMLKNIGLNNLADKITALKFGLGEENILKYFVFNPINTGASFHTTDPVKANCKADIRTFDSLLPGLKVARDERILFKLDIESMEIEAIRGAAAFIREYPNITFVLEDKHTGQDPIRQALSEIAPFEFGIVDDFNIFAIKAAASTNQNNL
jgi:FkbM family methyltransferase